MKLYDYKQFCYLNVQFSSTAVLLWQHILGNVACWIKQKQKIELVFRNVHTNIRNFYYLMVSCNLSFNSCSSHVRRCTQRRFNSRLPLFWNKLAKITLFPFSLIFTVYLMFKEKPVRQRNIRKFLPIGILL